MTSFRRTPAVVLGASILLVACSRAESSDNDSTCGSITAAAAQPDPTGAGMWAYLQEVDYRSNWQVWADKGELYTGQVPHGMVLTTYLTDVARRAVTTTAGSMPDGAIIIKENYMPDSTLAAVTVMYKRFGYNAEHNDWFFTKHLPSGELDKTPSGMPMEGRLPGCQACNVAVRNNEYSFTSPLSEGDR